jgi:hypothetical protein
VYAEKNEAAESKEAHVFNCAQRKQTLSSTNVTTSFTHFHHRGSPEHARVAASALRQVKPRRKFHLRDMNKLMLLGHSTLIVGLRYPIYAASLCGLWSVSRIFYTIGYSTGDAKRVSTSFKLPAPMLHITIAFDSASTLLASLATMRLSLVSTEPGRCCLVQGLIVGLGIIMGGGTYVAYELLKLDI